MDIDLHRRALCVCVCVGQHDVQASDMLFVSAFFSPVLSDRLYGYCNNNHI